MASTTRRPGSTQPTTALLDEHGNFRRYLTIPEAADYLAVTENRVKRLIYAERREPGTGLRAVRVGRSPRIHPADLKDYERRIAGLAA